MWLLPKTAEKPKDARIKSGQYKDWRNKTTMSSGDFENNLKNLKGTFAAENMDISEESIKNLKRIENGEADYRDVVLELKLKYMQRS